MATRLHHRVWTALRSFIGRRAAERELDDELRFHFEQMQAYEARARACADHAVPANDVYLRTRRRFGGFDQVKEACRDMRTLTPLEDFLKDLRFGARLLVRGPVFSIVAILSLALGIGATSAIFSLINAIVLRELPVEKAHELYLAQSVRRDEVHTRFSWPAFEAARDDGRRPRRDGRGQQHPLRCSSRRRPRGSATPQAGIRPRAAGLG